MTPNSQLAEPVVVDMALVEQLCLASESQESDLLRSAGLLTPSGLESLLDRAEQLVNTDPGKSQILAAKCSTLAIEVNAPWLQPRAAYLCARTHAMNAEFASALDLIKIAYEGYLLQGNPWEAQRTQIGHMSVLIDLGRYHDVLTVASDVLIFLNAEFSSDAAPPVERDLLKALVHQNEGVCYEQMGQYDAALAAYSYAEAHFEAVSAIERVGDISNNRGVVLLHLGRGQDALGAFLRAAEIFESAGLTLKQAQALVNVGNAYRLTGWYTPSLAAFGEANLLLEPLAVKADKLILLLDLADAYRNLNLLSEALLTYREANELLAHTGMRRERARALWGFGATLMAFSQHHEAMKVLDESAAEFAAAGNLPMLVNVLLNQTALQMTINDLSAARVLVERIQTLIIDQDWPVQHVVVRQLQAELCLPDTIQALAYLSEAKAIVEHLELPHLRCKVNSQLGQIQRNLGSDIAAEQSFQAAIVDIEWLRANLAEERMRVAFLSDKTLAYECLVRLHLDRANTAAPETASLHIEKAFATSERAKSRALVDVLNRVLDPRVTSRMDSAQLAQFNGLQVELAEIYGQMMAPTPGAVVEPMSSAIGALQARAISVEQDMNRLLLRVVSGEDRPLDAFTATPDLDTLNGQLPSDIVLLSYYIVDSDVIAFVYCPTHPIRPVRIAPVAGGVIAKLAQVERLMRRLTNQLDRFRVDYRLIQDHMQQLQQSTQRLLSQLYDLLIRPLESVLSEALAEADNLGHIPKLVIVPQGLLHQLPFHALFDGKQYLIDCFEISYAPSATVLTLCQKCQPPKQTRGLIMGVSDPTIPAAVQEAIAVADDVLHSELLIDSRATLAAFKAQAPGCSIIHLACHGIFRANNPMFSSLKLQDGWLIAADIMQYDLTGALVTLSACESGLSEPVAGDELLGLVRAFLGAGAATLVVSLWLVQDEATTKLMANWYSLMKQPNISRAAALRQAQLKLKEQYPHPYYWAPFILIGKRS